MLNFKVPTHRERYEKVVFFKAIKHKATWRKSLLFFISISSHTGQVKKVEFLSYPHTHSANFRILDISMFTQGELKKDCFFQFPHKQKGLPVKSWIFYRSQTQNNLEKNFIFLMFYTHGAEKISNFSTSPQRVG